MEFESRKETIFCTKTTLLNYLKGETLFRNRKVPNIFTIPFETTKLYLMQFHLRVAQPKTYGN